MSRLIDADDLLQEFENENVAHNSDIWHITGIKAFIENQPTAFDTGKVVEQLEVDKRKQAKVARKALKQISLVDLEDISKRILNGLAKGFKALGEAFINAGNSLEVK